MAVGDRIGIADKETLDKTKNNTDFIKGQFPLNISGGTDWSEYDIQVSNFIERKKINSFKEVLNITGQGVLISICQTFMAEVGYSTEKKESELMMTIDNESTNISGLASIATRSSNDTGSSTSNTLVLNKIFKNSLRISHHNSESAHGLVTFIVYGIKK